MAAIEDFLADCERRMDKSIEHTRTEFNSVRTGRASTALLDRITIDYYGTPDAAQEHGDDQRPGGRACSPCSRTTRRRSRRSRRRSWSPTSV